MDDKLTLIVIVLVVIIAYNMLSKRRVERYVHELDEDYHHMMDRPDLPHNNRCHGASSSVPASAYAHNYAAPNSVQYVPAGKLTAYRYNNPMCKDEWIKPLGSTQRPVNDRITPNIEGGKRPKFIDPRGMVDPPIIPYEQLDPKDGFSKIPFNNHPANYDPR